MKMYCFCKYKKEVSETEALEILKKDKKANLMLDTGEIIASEPMIISRIDVTRKIPILSNHTESSLFTLGKPFQSSTLYACEHCGRIIAIE